jgi:hypothetical protein
MRFDRYIAKRITDDHGYYRFLVPSGVYQVEVLNDDLKAVKYEGGSSIVDTKDERGESVINKNITVKGGK